MTLIGHLKHVLLDLQASWILWLLIGLSVGSLYVIVERALFFRSITDDIGWLSRQLGEALRAGRYREALEMLGRSRSPQAAIVGAGLRHADLGPASAEKAMAGATALQRKRLEHNLNFLGTLGNNAPFVGLLGTVIGVIEAFETLGKPDQGGVAGVSNQALMVGISEALVATAVGLFVAIPAVAAFNYFQGRIQSELSDVDALSNVLLAHLNAEAPAPEVGAAAEAHA